MKVAVVLALARYLRFRKDQVRLTGLVRPVVLTLVPMVLVVLQPDLGTSLMLPPVLVALLFVANAQRRYLAAAVVAGFLLVPAVLAVHLTLPGVSERIMRDYQMRRIEGFFIRDEQSWSGVNYQLRQSLIALGSGGLTGKGYHEGTQNLHGYLPAKHTDFIFSVVGEELGFLGAATVVLVYGGLVLAIFRVAVRVREPFPRLVAAGIGTLFAAQGAENLGMTLGLTPITGIPLPFVSYGGSSLVTSYLAAGIVLGIAGRNVPVVASPDLNPEEEEKVLLVIDDHPAGANLFPNSPY
jgi:rod shape determining protein RodA